MTRYGREKPPPGVTLDRGHPLAQGLAFLCALREGGGTSARESTSGVSGTLGSTVTWTQGPLGCAAQGDGTANGGITFAAAATQLTALVSLECWVYLGSTSLAGSFLSVSAGNNGYALGVGATSLATTGNVLLANYVNVATHVSGTSIGTGWHHVALVLDASGHPTFYLDGVRQSYTGASAPTAPTAGTTNVLGLTTSGPRYVAGAVAKASIYTRALGDSEIQWLYVAPYAPFRAAPPPWARRVRRSAARSSTAIVV